MIRTLQNTAKAIIILLMVGYIGQPKELYAAGNRLNFLIQLRTFHVLVLQTEAFKWK